AHRDVLVIVHGLAWDHLDVDRRLQEWRVILRCRHGSVEIDRVAGHPSAQTRPSLATGDLAWRLNLLSRCCSSARRSPDRVSALPRDLRLLGTRRVDDNRRQAWLAAARAV